MNPSYLKKYVQMHPGNKMAWYLLGKEYERTGQAGKANYCFNKAGQIYEAFESSKVPSELWKEYEARLMEASAHKDRRIKRRRRLLLALMLLLLMFIPAMDDPGSSMVTASSEYDPSVKELYTLPELPVNEEVVREELTTVRTLTFTASPVGDTSTKGAALDELLTSSRPNASLTAVLGMEQKGRWRLWKRDMPVLFTVERDAASGRAALQAYDARSCECKPPDAGPLQKKALQWTKEQEAYAVASSAIHHFTQKNGRLPTGLGELVKPFPDNWIAGTSPELERAYRQAVQLAEEQSVSQRNTEVPGTASNVDAGQGQRKGSTAGHEPYLIEPLEILVDKTSHQLALTSGNVVVRSYKVGLGGDRTPEGSYVVTDKVINPNGRDNGEFGSRGMQLSDTDYAIHGTNEPDSIGKDESLGCIRMSKEDVEELFDLAPAGTKVTIGKGTVPELAGRSKERFVLRDRQNQNNPRKVYRWLN
ncbi:L,D-transpeptidase [Paenibacillus sp. YPG26]|uniref:L,D-transpeptidase n=1 Tax=Paenibacillus sp. YPG26 TaxID=2878915 RepID=UPI00203E3CB8|nr:L,D-transpeptidase [Paenibacillus sp. YPG26]USB32217.1 L,D-transpeptidase [Paenibacillus sp. YPG26]